MPSWQFLYVRNHENVSRHAHICERRCAGWHLFLLCHKTIIACRALLATLRHCAFPPKDGESKKHCLMLIPASKKCSQQDTDLCLVKKTCKT